MTTLGGRCFVVVLQSQRRHRAWLRQRQHRRRLVRKDTTVHHRLHASLKSGTHWRRSWTQHTTHRPCCFGAVHPGNKVDRDKLSNSRCCRFVAKTGKVDLIRQQSTLLPICCRFRQQSTFNKVDRVEFNFVASVSEDLAKKLPYLFLAACRLHPKIFDIVFKRLTLR